MDNSGMCPDFLQREKIFLEELAKQGIQADPTCGFRSFAVQNDLYAKGRTKPGPKVTNARGGSSPHNYGMARDYVPVLPKLSGGIWKRIRIYGVKQAWWIKFGKAAKAAGLEWGGTWKRILDRPHIQLPDWKQRSKAMKEIYHG